MSQLIREARPLDMGDQRLVDAYVQVGRPVDDLPYTPAFKMLVESLHQAGDARDERTILRRLMNLRKAAVLPRLGRVQTNSLKVTPEGVARIEQLLRESLPTTGGRDALPYTPQFDELLERYNSESAEPLDHRQFWRLIARVTK
jgi:hypothetical protein